MSHQREEAGVEYQAVPGPNVGGPDSFFPGPSLDHAMWLHRPLDVQQWFLLDLQPLVAYGGRGLYLGGVYDPERRRCASISQELLTQRPPQT